MKKRMIGNLEVSQIGMGCMGFSHGYGKAPSELDSIQAIYKAYEAGCTFFDTAESYGKEQFYSGHNEQLVGKAVESFRKKIILATKLHIHNDELNNQETLYDIVFRHLQQSLKNLRTDYIDLYYQHRIDPKVEPEVVAGVMKELIAAGKIKAWGISETTEEYLRRAHAVCPVTAIQNRYSMMARWYEDLFVVCKELGITYVAFSPMANGLLSGKFTPDSTFEKGDFRNNMPQYQKEGYEKAKKLLNLLKVLSEKKNCTMAQLSIAWMLRKKDFIVPIPGSRKLERLEENFRAGEIEVTIDEIKEIDALLDTIDFDVFGGH